MYRIRFYKDVAGKQPVKEYIRTLKKKAATSKDARIKYEKITEYIEFLSDDGTMVGMPYVKRVEDEIWELRPLSDRIMFFCWNGGEYVMLHYFKKKTQKTPRREIEIAKRRMQEMLKNEGEKE